MSNPIFDLEAAVKKGELEYYPGKRLIFSYIWPGSKIPRVEREVQDEVDKMSAEEFAAYSAACKQFHSKYWSDSCYQVPVQRTAEQRREHERVQRETEQVYVVGQIERMLTVLKEHEQEYQQMRERQLAEIETLLQRLKPQ